MGGDHVHHAIAFGLIIYVTAFANDKAISVLGGTTSLLLLAVFAVVNVAVLVLRRDVQARRAGISGRRRHLPVIGCLASLYLVTPLSGRPVAAVHPGAAFSSLIGIVLFFLTMAINRQLGVRGAGITDPTHLGRPRRISSQSVQPSRIVLSSSWACAVAPPVA